MHPTIRVAGLCLVLATAAACTTGPRGATAGFASGALGLKQDGSEGDIDLTPTVQPRNATYACEEAGAMTVENLQTTVRIVDPDGESLELAASPPDQISRYGQTPNSLVLDGRDALYMKGNRSPVSCRR